MSTRVYTGFRFVSPDLLTITRQLKEIKQDLNVLQRNHLHRAVAGLLVSVIDRSDIHERIESWPETGPRTRLSNRVPLQVVMREVHTRRRAIRLQGQNDPWIDWSAGLKCWVSIKEAGVIGHTWGQLGKSLLDLLITKGVATSFGYWTTTDRDEKVSAREWNKRKRAWDEVLDNPVGLPITFDFDDESIEFGASPTWADIEPWLPARETRIETHTFSSLFRQWLAETGKVDTPGMGQHREFNALLKLDSSWVARYVERLDRVGFILRDNDGLAKRYNVKDSLWTESED